jgi:hypothetical protein
MEQICWVITPSCRICEPTQAQKHRFPCIGCDKQAVEHKNKQRKISKGKKSTRFMKINELKQQGFSFGYISKILNIPRSTVFYALKNNDDSNFL